MSDVTLLLDALARGEDRDRGTSEKLLPLVYEELRRLARHKMAAQPPGHTLQATALVHEAWLRLLGPDAQSQSWNGRGHFFSAAAEAMRRIIVEHTRRKLALKRGAGTVAEDIDDCEIALAAPPEEVVAVHEALDQLAAAHAQAAELVKLRYFVGLSNTEAADTLGLSLRATERLWTFARTWLHRQLGPESRT
jgi:RNA polymerase sigma factor (TIGR02999 family)